MLTVLSKLIYFRLSFETHPLTLKNGNTVKTDLLLSLTLETRVPKFEKKNTK